jgi:hypothetical protein
MRNRDLYRTFASVVLSSLGALSLISGCDPGSSTNDTSSTEAAIKAASAACTSARDACKMQVQSVAATIEAACAPAEAACDDDHHGGAAGAGGSAGSSVDCAAARAACQAAVVAAKPQLETIGMSCESSIHQACVVDRADGGNDDHRGEIDGGRRDLGESAACESAEATCRQSLESLRSMPPAACTMIQTACAGQTPSTVTDACKTAIGDCRDAVVMSATSAHQQCGADIAAACGGHGG